MTINKDQIKGRTNQAVGKVKEIIGDVVGNKNLEVKGAVQKNIGSVQSVIGDVKASIPKI